MAQKKLTAELIMFKTKTNNLDKIKNLNLCGNDLQDISIVSEMASLEVLSLSVNNINTLKDVAQCSNLKELYIRRNNIDSMAELDFLKSLPKLRIAWISENPIASQRGYRNYLIRNLPSLQKLDNIEITYEERQKAILADDDDVARPYEDDRNR